MPLHAILHFTAEYGVKGTYLSEMLNKELHKLILEYNWTSSW